MQAKRVFITGSNRGLGKELVKLLDQLNPDVQIYLSSRGSPQKLSEEWQATLPKHKLRCYQIDLNDHASIDQTVKSLKAKHITFDFIVANAAVGVDFGQTIPSLEIATSTLNTNVVSTIDFIKSFLPLLSPQGRVVIVSSFYGSLQLHSKEVKAFLTDPKITEGQILSLVEAYIEAAKKGEMGYFNWSAYKTSKAFINTWARFVLKTYLKEKQTFICVSPGWCSTDMGGLNAPLTPRQGAERIYNTLWLKEIEADRFYDTKFCSYQTCE